MAKVIQHKRGAKANLPKLAAAEFGFCTDVAELFIGGGDKNIQIPVANAYTGDMNALVSSGIYRVGTNTNLPSDLHNGQVLVMQGAGSDTVAQIGMGSTSGNTVARSGKKVNGAWTFSEWVKPYSDANKPMPDDIGALAKAAEYTSDANIQLSAGATLGVVDVLIHRYNENTLHTPYTDGLADFKVGVIITNAYLPDYASQVCIPTSSNMCFIRSVNNGNMSEWTAIATQDTVVPYMGTASDLNDVMKNGVFGWYAFYSTTAHAPSSEGITHALEGVVLNIPDNGYGYAQQQAFFKGNMMPVYRYMNGSSAEISAWKVPYLPTNGEFPMTSPNLFFNNGYGRVYSDASVLAIESMQEAMVTDRNGRQIVLGNAARNDLATALALRAWVNGSYTDYKLYGEHNMKTENWTFTLEDGSTVTKAVCVE